MSDVEKLKGWAPVDAVVVNGRPGLLWMDLRGVKFSEPFFQQTVQRLRTESTSCAESFTEFDAVLQLEKSISSLKPDGFIFHSSRCGSTLLANALKCLQGTIVLPEPCPIDKLLARFITDAENNSSKQTLYSVILRAVVSALGQQHCGGERRLFIKFSCCSTALLSQVRRIWPDVPWVFLYRDPVETIVSNLKTKPEWLLDSDRRILAWIAGVTAEQITSMSDEEICARSVGEFYRSAHELANVKSLLLNYSQLSVPTFLEVLRFFSVSPTTEEIDAIERISQLYSKDIDGPRSFVGDAASKQNMASSLTIEMAQTWASESYSMLESKRLTGATEKQVCGDLG